MLKESPRGNGQQQVLERIQDLPLEQRLLDVVTIEKTINPASATLRFADGSLNQISGFVWINNLPFLFRAHKAFPPGRKIAYLSDPGGAEIVTNWSSDVPYSLYSHSITEGSVPVMGRSVQESLIRNFGQPRGKFVVLHAEALAEAESEFAVILLAKKIPRDQQERLRKQLIDQHIAAKLRPFEELHEQHMHLKLADNMGYILTKLGITAGIVRAAELEGTLEQLFEQTFKSKESEYIDAEKLLTDPFERLKFGAAISRACDDIEKKRR